MVKLRVAGKSLKEIGKKYNLSKQRVQQILGNTGWVNEKPVLKKKCKIRGSSFETKIEKIMYCSTYCSGIGRRTLDIPLNVKVGSKEYEKLKSAIYYKKYPEKRSAYSKKWQDKNRERVREINRRYNNEHKEEIKKCRKEYLKKPGVKEKMNKKSLEYYYKHKNKISKQRKEYYLKRKLKTYYFTFGFGQKYENCFTVIKAKNYSKAREIMVDKFGLKWAFQYTEEQWICKNGKTQQEEFNLREIKN